MKIDKEERNSYVFRAYKSRGALRNKKDPDPDHDKYRLFCRNKYMCFL